MKASIEDHIEYLKEIGKNVSKGEWWMDSHGHSLSTEGEVIAEFKKQREVAHRDEITGNLSYWKNDSDASWIAATQPIVVLALIEELEKTKDLLIKAGQPYV